MFGQDEDYTEVTYYGMDEPAAEEPSEARYVEMYQEQQAGIPVEETPSSDIFPALQSILTSAGTVVSQYLGMRKAEKQSEALQAARATIPISTGGFALPSLTALGISPTMLLIGGGLLAFILLKGRGKGIKSKERGGR